MCQTWLWHKITNAALAKNMRFEYGFAPVVNLLNIVIIATAFIVAIFHFFNYFFVSFVTTIHHKKK